MEERNKKVLNERSHAQEVLERWERKLDGKRFRHEGKEFSFSVAGMFEEGMRPKIYLIIHDPDGFHEPYDTLTHNDPDIPLKDDQIIVRYDGHHIAGAKAGMASGLFEEVEVDNTRLGLASVWTLKGGL